MVGDDEGSWTTDGYLLPKINFAYEMQTIYLKQASGQNLERIVEIPSFITAQGTQGTQGLTSLAPFQAKGKPLEGLYQPLYLFAKLAGQQPSMYRQVVERKTLPFVNPTTVPATISWPALQIYYTWLGNQIYMTPVNAPIDILVDGRFDPQPLTKDTDILVVHPNMSAAVTSATLGLVGTEAGNSGYSAAAIDMVNHCADGILSLLIKEKQGYTSRAGRMTRYRDRSRWGWFWY